MADGSTSESRAIRVLLVDDQRLMREGLRLLIELESGLAVVGEADDGQAALEAFDSFSPDVVLMDVRMPGMDGVKATRQLRERHPNARVIILTTFDDDAYVFEGLRAGAAGYLLKDLSGNDLAQAVRTVAAGGVLIEPMVARKLVAEFARLSPGAPEPASSPAADLSAREREVLKLVAQGMTNREIAGRLFLAEGTVRNYVTSILEKVGARDRTQAALKAAELGILQKNGTR
jgi:DNA-binding NarL/FixJ family response regulator